MNALVWESQEALNWNVTDWCRITPRDLALLVRHAFPDVAQRPFVRAGHESVAPTNYVKGVPPKYIESELAALAVQATEIRNKTRPDANIRAAAFYHLRFEAIHPLTDGNGRIGRLIMAKQCLGRDANPTELLSGLWEVQRD